MWQIIGAIMAVSVAFFVMGLIEEFIKATAPLLNGWVGDTIGFFLMIGLFIAFALWVVS